MRVETMSGALGGKEPLLGYCPEFKVQHPVVYAQHL